MKAHKAISLILTTIMTISSTNLAFSEGQVDEIASGSAVITDSEPSEQPNDATKSTSNMDIRTIAKSNIAYPVVGGNIYFDSTSGKITDADDSIVSANIPSTINGVNVVDIEDNAFSDCSSLKSVAIPKGVTSIGLYSFSGCSSLTSVDLPDSVTFIGPYAFLGCKNLSYIELPSSITVIGYEAFHDCSKLSSIIIPDGVTSISRCTFSGCSSLANIELPNSVTFIGDDAFRGCTSLTNIEIPNVVTHIGDSSFRDCSSLTSITIPEKTRVIGWYAFSGCSSLTNVIIPDNIVAIGDSAFEGCKNLPNVTIPISVTEIGNYAFKDCSSLTNIVIPENVLSIGPGGFMNCSNLTSVKMSDSVSYIGSHAFEGCSSLTNIELSNNIYSIDNSLFNGCTSLTDIVIPNKVTSIGDSAFKDCSGLSSIILPNNFKVIGWYAFSGCSSLTSIVLPSSILDMGNFTFDGCNIDKLTFYTVPDSFADIWVKEQGYNYSYNIPDGTFAELTTMVYRTSGYYVGDTLEIYVNSLKKDSSAPLNVTWSSSDTGNKIVNIIPSSKSRSDSTYYYYDATVNFIGEGDVTITATATNGSSATFNLSATRKYITIDEVLINGKTRYDTSEPVHSFEITLKFSDAVKLNKDIAGITDYFIMESDKVLNGDFEETYGKGAAVLSDNVTQSDDTTLLLKFDTSEFFPNLTVNLNEGVLTAANSNYGLDLNSIFPIKLRSYDSKKQYGTNKSALDIRSAVSNYTTALEAYEKRVLKKIKPKQATTDEYSRMKSRLDGLLIGEERIPADAAEACRHALFEALKCIGDTKLDIKSQYSSDITKMSANIVNEVLNKMSSASYTYDNTGSPYKATANILGVENVGFGSVTYELKNTSNGTDTNTIAIVSDVKDVSKAIAVYINDVGDLGLTAVAKFVNTVVDEYSKAFNVEKYINNNTISGIDENNLSKEFKDYRKVFLESKKICTALKDYLDNPYSSVAAYNLAENLSSFSKESDYDLLNNTYPEYSKLKKAREQLIDAAIYHLANKEPPDWEDKFFDWMDRVFFNCPVDVYVYDDAGNELAHITQDEAVSNSADIDIDIEGETKIVYIKNNIPVSFKLVAYDYGMLNISEERKDSTGIPSTKTNFYDIPLEPDAQVSSNIVDSVTPLEIKKGDNAIEPDDIFDVSDNASAEISVTAENGSVVGTGSYVKGNKVELFAYPQTGYKFDGWYMNEQLLSTDIKYTFIAKENVALTAKFSAKENITTQKPGNINGDGEIDSRDSLILFKYIAGDAVTLDESLVDFNKDNIVDSRDSLILFKFVAGDAVTLE